MRKFYLLFAIAGFTLLVACSSKAQSIPAAGPTDPVYSPPDRSMATPAAGSAELPRTQGIRPLLLRSKPNLGSDLTGEIFPGDRGTVLGFDATNAWVLVQFGDLVGWTPANTLALVIVQ